MSKWNQQRRDNALRSRQLFETTGLDNCIGLPAAVPNRGHVWNQFTICVPDGQRDALRAHLAAASIGTEIYYPLPLHMQPCFAPLGYEKGSLPETERAADEVLSLPIFPALNAAEQRTVVARIADFYSLNAATAAGAPTNSAVGPTVEPLYRAS